MFQNSAGIAMRVTASSSRNIPSLTGHEEKRKGAFRPKNQVRAALDLRLHTGDADDLDSRRVVRQFVQENGLANTANKSTGPSFSKSFKPLFQSKINDSHNTISLRQRLIDYRTNRRRQKRFHSSSHSDLESSFADLRRVLNSYCEGIA